MQPAELKSYPAYKDSGVPWLGEVPTHWEVRRLKHGTALNPSRTESRDVLMPDTVITFLPMERVSSDGRIDPQETLPASKVWSGFTYFRRDDVLVAKITPCFENGKGAHLHSLPTAIGFGSTEFHVLRAKAFILPQFLYRLTTASEFRRLGTDAMTGAAGQQRVPSSFIANYSIPIPPLPEQTAIVRFLDHADRRIQRYLRAKQQLMALLEEQKQALIHQAVTGQIDMRTGQPYPAYKPSGVEWLGEVPAHWEVAALRRRWRVIDCKHLTVPFVDSGIPLASVREAQSFELNFKTSNRTTPEWHEKLIEGGREPRPGDLIYCRNVSVGAAALVTTEDRFAMGQDVCLIRSSCENQRWLNYFLHSKVMSDQLALILVGSTFNRINVADIKALLIAVPPVPEQDRIATFLDDAQSKLAVAIGNCRREQALLREYRTRLLADVVTGKLDVREAAAALPEIGPLAPEEPLADSLDTAAT